MTRATGLRSELGFSRELALCSSLGSRWAVGSLVMLRSLFRKFDDQEAENKWLGVTSTGRALRELDPASSSC